MDGWVKRRSSDMTAAKRMQRDAFFLVRTLFAATLLVDERQMHMTFFLSVVSPDRAGKEIPLSAC
jgi:hypothetical protein